MLVLRNKTFLNKVLPSLAAIVFIALSERIFIYLVTEYSEYIYPKISWFHPIKDFLVEMPIALMAGFNGPVFGFIIGFSGRLFGFIKIDGIRLV
jgi:hypothetical protein